MRTFERTNFRIIISRQSRNHRDEFFEKTVGKLDEILQKNWRLRLIDCENIEMWWNCKKNFGKVQRENFLEILVNYK